MAYSADLARELEGRIASLEARDNAIRALDEQNEELRDKVEELEERLREYASSDADYYSTVERLTDERNQALLDAGKRDEAIQQARSDLDTLSQVPLHDLEASIEDIRKALKGVL